MSIAFAFFNYISGFHWSNHYEQLQEKELPVDCFPHCILGIANTIALEKSKDPRSLDFLEHLILLLYTDTWSRTHFPVIMEAGTSQRFNQDITIALNVKPHAFSAIEIRGVPPPIQEALFKDIFETKQREKIANAIGINLPDWIHVYKETVINKKPLDFALSLDNPYYQREALRTQRSLNSVFSSHYLTDILDNGQIDMKLMAYQEMLLDQKMGNLGILFTHTDLGQVYIDTPIVRAFSDAGLLYHAFYRSLIYLKSRKTAEILKSDVKKKLKGLKGTAKWRYKLFYRGMDVDFRDSNKAMVIKARYRHRDPKEFIYWEMKPWRTSTSHPMGGFFGVK